MTRTKRICTRLALSAAILLTGAQPAQATKPGHDATPSHHEWEEHHDRWDRHEGSGHDDGSGHHDREDHHEHHGHHGHHGSDDHHGRHDGNTVCAALDGATPGLYGLCTAFCDAHAAGSVDPANLRRRDLRLLEAYDEKRQDGDPPMPCLIEPPVDDGPTGGEPPVGFCPCWTAEQLEQMMPPINNWDLPVPGACADGANGKVLHNYEQGLAGPGYSLILYGAEGCDVVKQSFDLGAPAGSLFFLAPDEIDACTTLLVRHAQKYATPGVWDCFTGQ